jgi:hypothetical protein
MKKGSARVVKTVDGVPAFGPVMSGTWHEEGRGPGDVFPTAYFVDEGETHPYKGVYHSSQVEDATHLKK